jgi:CRISPR system Cascade subunit CasB
MKNETTLNEPAGLDSIVHRIAGILQHGGGVLTSGDVAELRRMDPRRLAAPFFKLAGLVLDSELPGEVKAREDAETRWAAVVVGLAHLGDLQVASLRLGSALASAGFSELRFSRLLRSDTEQLVDEIPMVARFLAAKSVAVDFATAARLILSAGRSEEERVRRNIARDYFATLARLGNE